MRLRQLWILLSGTTLFVIGLLVGVSAPAGAETDGGCAGSVGDTSAQCHAPAAATDGESSEDSETSEASEGERSTSADVATLGSPRVECTLGGRNVVVALSNPGSVATDATVVIGDVTTPLTLAPGTNETVRVAVEAPQTSVRAVVGGVTVIDTVVDTSCGVTPTTTTTTTTLPPTTTTLAPTPPPVAPPPVAPPVAPPTTLAPPAPAIDVAAAQLVDCAVGEVHVLLGNFGTDPVMVDVALPRAALQPAIPLDGGALALSILSIDELDDGPAEIRISNSSTGELYVRNAFDIDCVAPAEPAASVSVDCSAGVLTVELTNLAGGPADLAVLQERVAVVAEVTLLAGESTAIEIALGEQRPLLLRVVDAEGNDVLREAVDHDCVVTADPADESSANAGDPVDSGEPAASEGTDAAPEPIECAAAVDIAPNAADGDREYRVSVELDGTVVIDGRARAGATLPVVPGVPTRIVVSDPADSTDSSVRATSGAECAEVDITMVPECAASSASVTLERTGTGRERFVVLVDGAVGGVLAIDGSGRGTVPVKIGSHSAELTVARSDAADPIVVGTLMCERSAGVSGPVAASLATLAVLAMAVGVLPRAARLRAL